MKLQWLKLDIDILDDSKIKLIRKHPAGDTILVLWIGLLCLAMRCEKGGLILISEGIPYNADDLSVILEIDKKTIQLGLTLFEKYNMIDIIDGDTISIPNFNKHQELDKIAYRREQDRERQRKYREKAKLLQIENDVTCDKPVSHETEKNRTEQNKKEEKKIPPPDASPQVFINSWNTHTNLPHYHAPIELADHKALTNLLINEGITPDDLCKCFANYANSLDNIRGTSFSKFIADTKKVWSFHPKHYTAVGVDAVPVIEKTPEGVAAAWGYLIDLSGNYDFYENYVNIEAQNADIEYSVESFKAYFTPAKMAELKKEYEENLARAEEHNKEKSQ